MNLKDLLFQEALYSAGRSVTLPLGPIKTIFWDLMRIDILDHERMVTASWNDRSAESLILTDGLMSVAIEMYRLVVLEDPEGMQKKHLEKLDLAEIAETLRPDRVLGLFVGKE